MTLEWIPSRYYLRLLALRDQYADTPTVEQIDAFVNDTSSDAIEKLVDSLLANKAYGERWGRHWLDVARYADSVTLRGLILTEAWRYRDYVINTFNEDRPFAEFIVEQIAGDLLPNATEQQVLAKEITLLEPELLEQLCQLPLLLQPQQYNFFH